MSNLSFPFIGGESPSHKFKLMRLTWKGTYASGSLEREVLADLGADSKKDRSLLMLFDDSIGAYIIFKDSRLLEKLRPEILAAKHRVSELRGRANGVVEG